MKQLLENDVTIESLSEIFESAFITLTDKGEDSFKIQGEDLNPILKIDKERKFLSFALYYGLKGEISLPEALLLTNKINEDYIFIRLAAIEYEGSIYLESKYYMSYEKELIPYHVIKLSKKFEKFTVDALREYFSDFI